MGSDEFVVKDSGKRASFDSGMVRDVEEGKLDYTLILDGPMLDRWANQLTKGAKKYDARNWMRAAGQMEYERFRRSALRHLLQWFRGERDEDHAAAVFFNINGAEYVKAKMAVGDQPLESPTGPRSVTEASPTRGSLGLVQEGGLGTLHGYGHGV